LHKLIHIRDFILPFQDIFGPELTLIIGKTFFYLFYHIPNTLLFVASQENIPLSLDPEL